MHDTEKSDSGIVAEKPTNKAGLLAAEWAEPRPGTKGNAEQQRMHRTQGRARMTQSLDRVRTAARLRKKDRFTALFHHINVDTLRAAFFALRRKAAQGPRGRSRAPARRSAQTGPTRSVSPATVSPDVHTKGRRQAAPVSDRGSRRQNRPGRHRHRAQRHLRRRLLWLFLRVSARQRTT